jgi:magnesium transporter
MRRSLLYRDGKLEPTEVDESISSAIDDAGSLLWLDSLSPTEEDFAFLSRTFGFHPLAMEDARRGGQRAKVDEYKGHNLIVMFDLSLDDEAETVQVRELTMFVSERYVITLHKEPIHCIDDLWKRLHHEPSILEPHPLCQLVYQLSDSLVDDYFPILDRFDERLAELEEQLFDGSWRVTLPRLFSLRKAIVAMRRLTNQMRDVFNVLLRREEVIFSDQTLPYYTDIYDHLLRISDNLEMQRDLLSGAVESYLSMQSNELNLTVRKLTAVTVLIMVPTLIAGIYGMNFDFMPELGWTFGYPLALGMMGLSLVLLFLFFRRIGWW